MEIWSAVTDALLTDWETDTLWKIELLSSFYLVGVELSQRSKILERRRGDLKEIFFSAHRSQNKESNPNQELEVVVASNAFFISTLVSPLIICLIMALQ